LTVLLARWPLWLAALAHPCARGTCAFLHIVGVGGILRLGGVAKMRFHDCFTFRAFVRFDIATHLDSEKFYSDPDYSSPRLSIHPDCLIFIEDIEREWSLAY